MAKEIAVGAFKARMDMTTVPTSGASGRQIRRWINEKTGVGTETVLTDAPAGVYPGIYYNLSAGETVHVLMMCYGLATVSDNLVAELGMCSAVDGGGDFIPLTPKYHIATGATIAGHLDQHLNLDANPISVPYSTASLSITIRVNANDAGAKVTVGWKGFSM